MEIVVPDEFSYLYVRNEDRPVWKVPDPVLRKVCQPIPKLDKKVQEFIDTMMSALKLAHGVGIAAPQMGKAIRLIVVAPVGMKPTALINPVLSNFEGEQIGQEGCLSIPGLYGDVKRAHRVTVEALDRRGKPVTFEMEGMAARVVQHEVDHLDGVLFIDKVELPTLHWAHPEGPDDDDE